MTKEEKAEYHKEYRRLHPEKFKKYWEKAKDRKNAYGREWRKANRAKLRVTQQAYYSKPENKLRRRHRDLLNKYGLTPEQYEAIWTAQGKVCAICKGTEPGGKREWHIDHHHPSERVRGILCHSCNTAIGLLKEDPNLFDAAKTYLL